MTLLTNGQQVFALTDRKFNRDRVLRVFLGGQNDTDRAIYLSRVRVIANGGPVGRGNAAAAADTTLFGAPNQRVISLAPISAAGELMTQRVIKLPEVNIGAADSVDVVNGQVTTTLRVIVNIPGNMLQAPIGKQTSYTCDLRVHAGPRGTGAFSNTHPDPLFHLTPLPQPAQGTFVW